MKELLLSLFCALSMQGDPGVAIGRVDIVIDSEVVHLPRWGALELRATLANSTPAEIPFSEEMLAGPLEGAILRVLVRSSDKPEDVAEVQGRYGPAFSHAPTQTLGAGDQRIFGCVVAGQPSLVVEENKSPRVAMGPVFGELGTYEVTLVYRLGGIAHASNPITVHVTEPSGEAATALKFVETMQRPEYVYYSHLLPALGQRDGGAAVAELERLAHRYGPNPFTDYARLTLAQWHLRTCRARTDVSSRATCPAPG